MSLFDFPSFGSSTPSEGEPQRSLFSRPALSQQVIDEARRVTGHPIPAKEEARRAGDPAQLIASSEKAKSVLGWKPEYDDLNTIIQTAWDWHKNHPHGYED